MGGSIWTVSKRVGHASIRTTVDIYGHLDEGAGADAADKIGAYLDATGTA
ncbi:MAG TPA: hypothetical protein VIW94_10710 [Acidimicrobiia bacterium]